MGEIILDDIAHAAYVDKQQIELTPKEYDLLQYFFENKGIALTRERILNTVWDYDYYVIYEPLIRILSNYVQN